MKMMLLKTTVLTLSLVWMLPCYQAGTGEARPNIQHTLFPTVSRDPNSCSYIINIPAPDTCRHFEYESEMDALKERVRILEAIVTEIIDSRDAIPDASPSDWDDEYSMHGDLSSSVVSEGIDLDSSINDKKPPLREVRPPPQPVPPLFISGKRPSAPLPEVKPHQDDFVQMQPVIVAMNQTHVARANNPKESPKLPSSITSIRPGNVQSTEEGVDEVFPHTEDALVPPSQDTLVPPSQDTLIPPDQDTLVPPNQDVLVPLGQDALVPLNQDALIHPNQDTLVPLSQDALIPPNQDILIPPSEDTLIPPSQDVVIPPSVEGDSGLDEPGIDLPHDIVTESSPASETENQVSAHFPVVQEADTSSEKSMTSELEGGSLYFFSSSDGGAADFLPNENDNERNNEPENAEAEEGREEPTTPAFMKIMTEEDGHRGDLRKPRWKIFKELMDLKSLRGRLPDGEKRPRPKGKGKPNDCIVDGCLCLRKKGFTQDGIYYTENPDGSQKRGKHVRLYCDMTTDGGGWTVIQNRRNGTTNFYRGWDDYAKGFGYLDTDFWIGNYLLHAMTKQTNFMLRVEFTDWDDVQGYAEYSRFSVKDETDYFRLILGNYLGGNAGDALSYHNNSQFSTRDRDHDSSLGNCAFLRQAGFWFRACNRANPNGRYLGRADARGLNGAVVSWGTWEGHKYTYCLKTIRMMIRSQNPLSALTSTVSEMEVDPGDRRDADSRDRRHHRHQ